MTSNLSPKTDYQKIMIGDRLSEVQYYQVLEVGPLSVKLQNEAGLKISVAKKIVEECMWSAGQFNNEIKISRTEMAERLRDAGDTIFTVCFNKKAKPEDLAQKIYAAVERKGSAYPKKEDMVKSITRLVKSDLVGEERILTGYLCRTGVTESGYSLVIDLEQKGVRQVDHRSLNWLILRGTKYVLKK